MQDGLRPQIDWGAARNEFAQRTSRQTLLCVTCLSLGVADPPTQIVVLGGDSLCLDHVPNGGGGSVIHMVPEGVG